MNELERNLRIKELLVNQNALIDSILSEQLKIREAVKTRDWIKLQHSIDVIQKKSNIFVILDAEREELSNGVLTERENISLSKEIRQKLVKSKIENKALGNYVEVVKGFVQNVLDNIVPQRRNTLYSNTGKIVHTQPESVVLNQLF